MPHWTVAPAVKAALTEATRMWPKRGRAHDGTVGDTAHSTRTSDHNPDERGVVLAFDITHDPRNGCDAHALVRAAVARRDRRIKYAISNGQIWSRERAAEGWRRYTGSNPHDKHAHVSVSRRYENDTSPWWTAPPAPRKADEMSPAQEKKLDRVIDLLEALVAPRDPSKADRDTSVISLGDIVTKIETDK